MSSNTNNNNLRMFCVDNDLVLLKDGQIVEKLDVDHALLYFLIIKAVKSIKRYDKMPSILSYFKEAIEALFPQYKFAKLGYKYEGKTIHESELFRKYSEIILKEINDEAEIKRKKKCIEEQRKIYEQQSAYIDYCKKKNEKILKRTKGRAKKAYLG